MLGLSAGIMLAVVFLELLKEALSIGFFPAFMGLFLGIVAFVLLDSYFLHRHFISEDIKGAKGGRKEMRGGFILFTAGI